MTTNAAAAPVVTPPAVLELPSAELQEARRQEATASHRRLYELAEKITGMSTAKRVASVARKR